MSIKVYPFPAVPLSGTMYERRNFVQRSRSLLTGADYMSVAQRPRWAATFTVPSLAYRRDSAGYMEVLKRLLKGGVNAVRFNLGSSNWWMDTFATHIQFDHTRVRWQKGFSDIEWTNSGGRDIVWEKDVSPYSAMVLPENKISIMGFEPNAVAVRAGEWIRLTSGSNVYYGQALFTAAANSDRIAHIQTYDDIPVLPDSRIEIGVGPSVVISPLIYL